MKKKTFLMVSGIASGILFLTGIAEAQNSNAYVREVTTPYASQKTVNKSKAINETYEERNLPVIETSGALRAEAETAEVTITLTYDKDKYGPDWIFFHSNDNPGQGVRVRIPEEDTFSAAVPKGSYWVNVIYRNIVRGLPNIHLIKEDLEVSEDMSLTFDAADAVNRITFKPLLPDGEIALPDLDDIYGEIIEPGNIKGGITGPTVETVLYEETIGSFSTLWGGGGRMLEDGEIIDFNRTYDILINPVSRRFTCTQVAIMADQEGKPIVTNMGSYMDKSYSVSNNPSDYRFVENEVIPSLNNDPNKNMYDYGIMYCSGYNGEITSMLTKYTMAFETLHMYLGLSNLDVFTKNTSEFICLKYVELRDDNSHPNEVALSTAPYTNVDNKYNVFNYSTDEYYSGGIFTADQSGLSPILPNPIYSHSGEQFTPVYGNTVPFVAFLPMITYSGNTALGFTPNFKFYFVGMNGEVRGSDAYAASLDVKYQGNTVFDSMPQVNGWCWGWFADGANRGEYDITVVDENMKVDDMIGRNETLLHFDTANSSDCVPPLLTWMQYRDKTDLVTNSIKEKDGARLFFSSGDFDFNCNEDWNMWFTCRETQPEVKVEYAPHGSSEFSELTVVERPEDFWMPGFGFQYEVALDQVERKANGGWFDLRVNLADNAGNYQTQLMSPAFRLEDQSGVESIHDFIEGVRVDGRNIIAPEGVCIYRADGTRSEGRNVEPGIYIVRQGDRSLKLRIK